MVVSGERWVMDGERERSRGDRGWKQRRDGMFGDDRCVFIDEGERVKVMEAIW